MHLSLLGLLVACTGPGAHAPVSAGAGTAGADRITFHDARWLDPQEGMEASAVLELVVRNGGEALLDYPSIVLETDDRRLDLGEEDRTLYGLAAGDTPMSWLVVASQPIEPGDTVSLTATAYETTLDAGQGQPIGRASLEVPVTKRLSPL